MTNSIVIEGMRFRANHGCLEDEAKNGGDFIVDVYMTTDFSEAVKSDSLQDTIDYCAVREACASEMKIRSNLIEQVCERIYKKLSHLFPALKTLKVRVTKLTLPLMPDTDKVSVEIED
jgi:dihydroneopterin aldolase